MRKLLIVIYFISINAWSEDFVDYKQCRNVESSVECDRSCKVIGKIKITIDKNSEQIIKTVHYNDGVARELIEPECEVVETNRFECRHADASSFRYEYYDGERYRSGTEMIFNPTENVFNCAVINEDTRESGWLKKFGL
jgi:hypothetical protein